MLAEPRLPLSLASRVPSKGRGDDLDNNKLSSYAAARIAPHPVSPFTDVPSSHWAASAIDGLVKRHILDASRRSQFKGEKPVTRYELALALYRMVRYLEPARHGVSAEPHQPAEWLVSNSYLPGDTLVARSPAAAPISPALLSESLAYVADRILLHRATPQELKEQSQ